MPLNATLTGSGWIVSIDTNGPRRAVTGNTVATAADVNGRIDVNSASPVQITIPDDSTGPWQGSEMVAAYQAGTGAVSFVAGSGVTLRSPSGIASAVQYGTIAVQRVGPNEWALV
jgi:hypothetical protein